MNSVGFHHRTDTHSCAHDYLLPALYKLFEGEVARFGRGGIRVFDLGCGNGSVAHEFHLRGFDVLGVDPSLERIALGRAHYPHLRLEQDSSESDLAARYGRFPVVLSIEVIEHVSNPRQFAARVYDLLEPGGLALISTPYHGYFKNLLMALAGKLDAHFTALWDGGHIKFWSVKTLRRLLADAGFRDMRFRFAGRIRPLAKSMIATARK